MSNKRKKYSAQEKVRLLRLHLIEKEPVSDICDRHGLNPNVFYRWQRVFFENGTAAALAAADVCLIDPYIPIETSPSRPKHLSNSW